MCESELPPVVVVPGGVGTHMYTALHRLSWKTASAALGSVIAVMTGGVNYCSMTPNSSTQEQVVH